MLKSYLKAKLNCLLISNGFPTTNRLEKRARRNIPKLLVAYLSKKTEYLRGKMDFGLRREAFLQAIPLNPFLPKYKFHF
jgi:hypothetical protein